MFSQWLDPRDGTPRDPVLWLVLGALASTLLLAFYLVCTHQVRKAETRRTLAQVQQMAHSDCLQYLPGATIGSCLAPMRSPAGLAPVGFTPR